MLIRKGRQYIIGIIWLLCATLAVKAEEPESIAICDSLTSVKHVATRDSSWYELPWYSQLLKNGFQIHEQGINYSAFPRLCLAVYDWGNKTFNTYDTRYVVGTGKNWKIMTTSNNWTDSYALFFNKDSYVRMQSGLYSDVGLSLHFMAVSIGYSWNVNKMFQHSNDMRKTFEFNFSCALFSAGFNYRSTTGGTTIRHFGDYNDGHHISYDIDDITQKTISGEAYYFFNHARYSQAAAYKFSKYQLRSSGSWIVGVDMAYRNLNIDFSSLPDDMRATLPDLQTRYCFSYADYDVLGGYAYNWVFRPKWVFNVTALPSIGYKHSYEDATDGSKDLFATNMKLRLALTYNHRALFLSLQGRADGHFYTTKGYSFIDSTESLALTVGARF